MKVDLHAHIKRTSRCAKHSHIEMAVAAKEKGLDGIVLLDHHYYPTKEECLEAEKASGIKIFKGIEITVKKAKDAISGTRGGANDVLVISPETPNFDIGGYHKPINCDKLPELLDFVKQSQGLSILAHPFRRDKPLAFNPTGIDCVEIASRNTQVHNREKILELAETCNLIPVSNSDAHRTKHLGNYCIELDYFVDDEIGLAKAIKKKHFSLFEKRLAPVLICPRNF